MNLDKQTVTVAVALDAIAMAEHCMGNGNVPVSTCIRAWWNGCNDEGAAERRDRLVALAARLHKEIDQRMADVLMGKYGDAWDWDVLPELLEAAFRWNRDGKLDIDWDAPMRLVAQIMKHEEACNDRN